MKKYTQTLFIVFYFFLETASAQKINLSIHRDSLKGENTLYMIVGNEIKDSVVIEDLDYIKDSLYRVNDTLWHYIYSIGFDTSHNMITVRQVLIENLNNKIHFSFANLFSFYEITDYDSVYFHYSDFNYKYDLNLFDKGGITLNLFYYNIRFVDNDNNIDTIQTIVFLDYDAEKKIYYSSIDELNGEYYFYPSEPKKRNFSNLDIPIVKHLKNERVFAIHMGIGLLYYFVYFENRWFIVTKFPYHTQVIPLFPFDENK